MTAKVWRRQDIEALGTRTTIEVAGSILGGLCRTESYELHKRGKFPVPVLQVGRRLVVPVQPILDVLGLAPPGTAAAGPVETGRTT